METVEVRSITPEFLEQLNDNFASVADAIVLVTDVPELTSQFVGVDPAPSLSTSPVGAISEVITAGNMGTGNLGVGPLALGSMVNGAVNVAVGYNALGTAQHEAYSVAVGWGALALSEGYENTGVGYGALKDNTTGVNNCGVGAVALYDNTTGDFNTGVGSHAVTRNTTGIGNTGVGYEALFTNLTGIGNSALGVGALYRTLSEGNSAFGYNAMLDNEDGIRNVALGRYALYHSAGSYNVSAGYLAAGGAGLTADGVVALGYQAGVALTGDADYNVLIGYQAGFGATTGVGNVLVGPALDTTSYGQVVTGSRNVSIGYNVAVASTTADYQLCISNFMYGTVMSGSGATVSTGGKLGLAVKAPETLLHLNGPLTINPTAAPAAPSTSGAVVIYVDSGDGNKLKAKASNGTVATLLTP